MSWQRRAGISLAGGILLSAGLPPLGWWPLALIGAGLLATAVASLGLRRRAVVGAAAGLGFLGPGLVWMTEFHVLGYALAVVVETALFTLGVAAVPPRRRQPTADRRRRWSGAVALPCALVLAEAVRGAWPFGGVPIATLAQTQIGGPLAFASRLGGGLAVAGLVGVVGVALAALARRAWRQAAIAAAAVAVGTAGGLAAPGGRAVATLEVAAVQAGGERGLRAVDNPSAPGFQAALAASQRLPPGLQLVVWPEDGVKVEGEVEASSRGQAVADLARRLGATVVSGVSQRQGERFRNQAVAWGPDGAVVDRYQKNQRVPFGEYVPARSLLAEVVDLRAVPRDAVAGTGAGLLSTPAGDLGVMISYEVFFPRRARAAVSAGAEVLLVPTNASSFSSTQMPALELGAARLRAIETGRSLVQAAPTGFSAIIEADGSVRSQSDLGDPAVLRGTVERRTGSTPYARWGDGPVLALAALALAVTWIRVGRSPGTHRQRPGRPFLLDEGP